MHFCKNRSPRWGSSEKFAAFWTVDKNSCGETSDGNKERSEFPVSRSACVQYQFSGGLFLLRDIQMRSIAFLRMDAVRRAASIVSCTALALSAALQVGANSEDAIPSTQTGDRDASASRSLPRVVAVSVADAASNGVSESLPAHRDALTSDGSSTHSNRIRTVSTNQSAESEPVEPEYVRIRRDNRRLAMSLDTSVVTMTKSRLYRDARVDLIGAIHLGEPEYYSQLNELFKEYDVVLFEAVMPEEAVAQDLRPGGGKGGERRKLTDEEEWTETKIGLAAISVLQLGMKDALGLQFQLAGIDYSGPNFVHADMTSEEFEESMRRRGESFSEMLAREMSKAVVKQQEQNPLAANLDLMLSALSSDRVYRIRRIAAVQLAKADEAEAFAGPDGTSTIITERNIKALQILKRELRKGRKKIGIFYGAGHLTDMEQRMVNEFQFQRTGEQWLTAWHLRNPESAQKGSTQPDDAGRSRVPPTRPGK
jgi:hypothetical protein